jgi:hypothetical protein
MNYASYLAVATVLLVIGLILIARGKAIASMRKIGIIFLATGIFGLIYFLVNLILFILNP